MGPAIIVKEACSKDEVRAAFLIREGVFVREQKVPSELEWDGLDDRSEHLIARTDMGHVGCSRLRVDGSDLRLERLAVLKEHRSKGVGSAIVRHSISLAKRKGAKKVLVHSQVSAKGFYARFGFKERGETFMDAGIEHILMELELEG